MSAILVLILRILLAVSLYAFLGWAIYTIWLEIRLQSEMIKGRQIPKLTISTIDMDEDITREFDISEIIMGRNEECEMHIPDDTVSARHARLSFHHAQWWIEDLQSTNGTFLNEERIYTPTVIISGDEVQVGKILLKISFNSKR